MMKLGIHATADDKALAGRFAWSVALRLLLLSVFLAVSSVFYFRGELPAQSGTAKILFATIAAAFGISACYALVLRTGRKLDRLVHAQLIIDPIVWTGLVYATGGATSGATSVYALTALCGAILTGLPGATIGASASIGTYGLMCLALWLGWLVPPEGSPSRYVVDGMGLLYPLCVNSLGIIVVALLGGYLAERLRIAGGQLQEAQRRAEQAERLATLGKLAAGLAHEIRNPLGSISGSVQILSESPGLSQEDRTLCLIIAREVDRLNNLVSDMVDLSRPKSIHPETVDVTHVAREIVALASKSHRGVDVCIEYDGPETPVRARCDPSQIRQVIWNLVRNAVQASPAGSSVRVKVARVAQEVCLTVEDEGPGIPADERDKIFDAFYTRRTNGTGIGLAVVKRIVDEHAPVGARICVDNSTRRGAQFSMWLRSDDPPGAGARSMRPSLRP